MGSVEACRRLGIGHKTGYRWRTENGGLQPDYLPEASRSGRYLSLLERRRIASLLAGPGPGPGHPGDSRPAWAGTVDGQPQVAAQQPSARLRQIRPRPCPPPRPRTSRTSRRSKLSTDPDLKAEVQDKLNLEWSPEQIAAHLRSRRPDRPERHLRHETVYRALYQGAKGGLSRTLTRKLRTGRPLRKQRRRSDQRMPTPGPSSTTRVQRSRLQVALLSRHPSTRTGSSAISGRKVAPPALPTYRTTTRSGSRTEAISSTPGRGSCGSGAAELRGHRRPRHPAPTRELLPLHSRRPGTAARRVRRD